MRLKSSLVICVLAMGVAMSVHARVVTECTMTYNLKGWSAFYKKAAGTGTIRCDNGQKAQVKLSTRGGGLTAGKTEIKEGIGYFSEVASINELFGQYGSASASAAAGKAASAARLKKGNVYLTLTGTGKGVELGLALSRFTITKR